MSGRSRRGVPARVLTGQHLLALSAGDTGSAQRTRATEQVSGWFVPFQVFERAPVRPLAVTRFSTFDVSPYQGNKLVVLRGFTLQYYYTALSKASAAARASSWWRWQPH